MRLESVSHPKCSYIVVETRKSISWLVLVQTYLFIYRGLREMCNSHLKRTAIIQWQYQWREDSLWLFPEDWSLSYCIHSDRPHLSVLALTLNTGHSNTWHSHSLAVHHQESPILSAKPPFPQDSTCMLSIMDYRYRWKIKEMRKNNLSKGHMGNFCSCIKAQMTT